MKKILNLLKDNKAFQALLNKQNIVVNSQNAEALLIASAFLTLKKNMLIIKSNQYEANLLYKQVSQMIEDVLYFPVDESYRIESLAASGELLGQRLSTMYELSKEKPHLLISHGHSVMRYVPSKDVFKKNCMTLKVGDHIDVYDLQRFLIQAGYMHTTRVDQPFYFSKRGGVIDVFSMQYDHPIRIDFFDDEIDYLKFFDEKTQRTIEKVNEIEIIPATDLLYLDQEVGLVITKIKDSFEEQYQKMDDLFKDDFEEKIMIDIENLKAHATDSSQYAYYHLFKSVTSIKDYLKDPVTILCQKEDIDFQIKNYLSENFYYYQELSQSGRFLKDNQLYQNFDHIVQDDYQCINTFSTSKDDQVFVSHDVMFNRDDEKRVIQQINDYLKNSQILISLENKHQLQLMIELFDRHEMKYTLVGIDEVIYPGINLYVGNLSTGIELMEEKTVILTAHELFGEVNVSKAKYFRFKDAKTLRNFQELNVGDYVVHDSYGIGQYLGIKTLDVKGYHKDYLYVAYAGDDTLYIPVEQFKMIRKYASSDGKVPMIHALGSSKWAKAKQRAKNKIDDIADQLIELYAARMSSPGFSFSKDNELQIDFENQFGYELTKDQQRSVDEIKMDMEKPQPMDRLLCGDVGFGKTEVALRGAFKAILDHKQVAFLCPTTILSMQHFKTATERFKNFPVEIALLNRFTSSKEKKRILKEVKEGKIDLLIGTHRILSKDVQFSDLGLLVIDEEQRFGVKQKEKIKEYRETIDVLSLSATPIPRTLQMSLMGIRGLSKIDTPPKNRLPVQTYVVEKNDTLIKQVIERELARDGQVFYLYNHTDRIANVAYKIASTVPNAKVAIGHGQMDKNELEDVMLRFMNKEFNVLICTTIIETGIDIPNANTMIVEDADKFGLAQLYQIRGRVGRSERGAYAYLLYKKDKAIQDDALKRLKAIKEFTELGSGYKIAMRDLSIRGSGDILGGRQAGFIDDIGFEMYMKILQDAINVRMHKEEKTEENIKNLNVNVDGYIPDDYVESDYEKLELYQRLDEAKTMSELNSLKAEFDDYYGNLPEAIQALIEKRKLEILSHYSIIEDIKDHGKKLEIIFSSNAFEIISGDKLFLLANQLFTKPAFKSLDNQVTITIQKNNQWLNHLNEFIETLSKK